MHNPYKHTHTHTHTHIHTFTHRVLWCVLVALVGLLTDTGALPHTHSSLKLHFCLSLALTHFFFFFKEGWRIKCEEVGKRGERLRLGSGGKNELMEWDVRWSQPGDTEKTLYWNSADVEAEAECPKKENRRWQEEKESVGERRGCNTCPDSLLRSN